MLFVIYISSFMSNVEVTLQLTVSQYVKVSSPFWGLWPNIIFCPKVVSVGRPLWREVGSVVYLSQSGNLPVFTSSIYVTCVLQFSNLYAISIKLHSVPSEYSRKRSRTSMLEVEAVPQSCIPWVQIGFSIVLYTCMRNLLLVDAWLASE
jgi:hypothetical protein